MNMRVMRKTILGIPIVSLAAVLSLATSAAGQTKCGPGSNWVQGCPAADDVFTNTGAVVGLDITLDGQVDTNLVLNGPATIRRSAEAGGVISTEILNMSLTGGGGITLTAGAQQLTPGGVMLAPSLGQIEQQAADDTLADSFFCVFFEIQQGGEAPFLYNHDCVRVEAAIKMVPPAAQYFHVVTSPIKLFTAPAPGGMHVANLVTAKHDTRPTNAPAASEWGMAVMVLLLLGGIAVKFGRHRAVRPAA